MARALQQQLRRASTATVARRAPAELGSIAEDMDTLEALRGQAVALHGASAGSSSTPPERVPAAV